jgi:putative AlgH/UPF0301 family transcriptional regulator
MEKDEIIKQKFLNTWPKSWAIFEESCQYSIKHNLDFVVGILLNEEKEISYADLPLNHTLMKMKDGINTLKIMVHGQNKAK